VTAARAHRGVVLAVILVGYLLILIDVSILMAALTTIHRDLGFSLTSLSWAQNAYTLTFGGLLLLGARAGDLAGRRRMFVVGIALFAAASLAVGLARSPAWISPHGRCRASAPRCSRPRPWRCSPRASPRGRSGPARWPRTARWPASEPRSASSAVAC
jgi:hypothetical protein